MTNVGPALLGGRLGLRCTEEGLPHPSPPLWIPAFAGMTRWGAGVTKWGAGTTISWRAGISRCGGPGCSWEGGLASDAPRRACLAPLDSAPLDSGPYRGTGQALRRNDEREGAGMTIGGGRDEGKPGAGVVRGRGGCGEGGVGDDRREGLE